MLMIFLVLPCAVTAAAAEWGFLGLTGKRVQTIELAGNLLYAGTFEGVYRLDLSSSGATWDTLGLADREIWALLVLSPDTLLAAAMPGSPTLYRTTDAGLSWQPFDSGFAEEYHPVRDLAKLPGQSDTLFASGFDICRSTNGGQTWQQVHPFSGAFFMAVDPNDQHTVYEGGESMIFAPVLQRSSVGGATWEWLEIWAGGDNSCHDIAIYPGNSAAAWISMEGQIQKTSDSGYHWSTVMTNNRYLYGIEIDRIRPQNLYVIGTQGGFPLTMYVSRDGGIVWDTLLEPSHDVIYPLDLILVSESARNVCYVGSSQGVFTYTETFSPICGDVDGDGQPINISDLVYLVDYMFTGGPPPPNVEMADVDGSGGIDISDLVYLVDYMFTGGPEPTCEPTPGRNSVPGRQEPPQIKRR